MDLYSNASSSRRPQLVLVLVQLLFISVPIYLLVRMHIDLSTVSTREIALLVLVTMNIITFVRFMFTLFVFIQREIPAEEIIAVSCAFVLYYVGYFLLAARGSFSSVILVIVGGLLFLTGSLLNSISEFQRKKWKEVPENRGKVFTGQLFGISRHPNYFGDLLWVLGYAVVSGNAWSLIIPLLLFGFFVFYNIPLQEKHMVEKYGVEFESYSKNVKSFIPYVL